MEKSILISIKKLLGISKDCNDFDQDVIIHINTVFTILRQIGIGPDSGFRIEDDKKTWDDFINNDEYLDDVKTYIYLKVRLIFDPPLNSSVTEAMKQTISELEWRLNIDAESNKEVSN